MGVVQMVHELVGGHQHDGLRFPAHVGRMTADSLGQVIAGVTGLAAHVHQMALELDLQTRFLKDLNQRRGLCGLAFERAFGKGGFVATKLIAGCHQPDAPVPLPNHGTGRRSFFANRDNKVRLFNPMSCGQCFPFLRCRGGRKPVLERHTMELFGHGATGHHAGKSARVLPACQWRGLAGGLDGDSLPLVVWARVLCHVGHLLE